MIQHMDMNFPNFGTTVSTLMNVQLKLTSIKVTNRLGSIAMKHNYFST